MSGNAPLTFLKKAWLPLLIVVVLVIAGMTVGRVRTFFGAEGVTVTPRNFADDPEPFDPKVVTYEVFGTGTLRRHQLPRPRRQTAARRMRCALPWSLTLQTTAPSAVPNIVAQGDGSSITCRITRRRRGQGREDVRRLERPDLLLGEVRMSAHAAEAPTDAFPPARHAARPLVPRLIRTLAVPIILGWIALIAVAQHRRSPAGEVGQMRSVSMSPDDAPSMIAMKQVGEVFEEYDSDSSVMIVLEGQEPLGDEAHAFYDEMVEKLRGRHRPRAARAGLLGRSADRRRRAEHRRQGRLRPGLSGRQPGRGAGQRVGRGRRRTSSTDCSRRRA